MGWLDKLQDGGEFLGTTNKGFNYNGAWGGPAQNGTKVSYGKGDKKIPLLERDIQNQYDFMRDWAQSPQYNTMVDNSTTGPIDSYYLKKHRQENLDNTNFTLSSKSPFKGERKDTVGGMSDTNTGNIAFYPAGYYNPAFPRGMAAHEVSHNTDRPNRNSTFIEKVVGDPYIDKEKRIIPEKDLLLMDKYRKVNPAYKKNNLNPKLLSKDEKAYQDYYNYISNPTETRARLNHIRYDSKTHNIYDPFTQKVNPEILKNIEDNSQSNSDYDPYSQLRDVYTPSQILDLLNKVSDNSAPSDKNKQTAQNGASMAGSVGFSYARTGAPSNGKYAKKTMPSAQHGLKSDVRKQTDLLRVPMWAGANQEEEYIPVTNKIVDTQNRDALAKTAAQDFTSWYGNSETIKKFGKNTGMDPRRLGDLVGRALRTPSEQYASDDSRRQDNNAQFFSPLSESNKYGMIRYNKQEKDDPSLGITAPNMNAAIQHEFGHAGSIDDVLGPSLMRVLGNPNNQKKNYLEGVRDYLSQPQEAYGNFHQMRIELGLKPGQKVDVPTLQKLIKEKKLDNSNFYKTFDDDKIVKAINTIASTNKTDNYNSYAQDGKIIDDEMGQWAHPGKITRIPSNHITMQGVGYPVLGISDTGDKKLMKPGKDYKFKGSKVTEYPMIKNGGELTKLDQLTNFTNYNKPQPGGWLDNL